MQKLILLTYSIFYSFQGFSQIPNASFEEWEMVNGYERPVGWLTNQDSTHEGLVKSDISYEGNSSLLLFPSEEDSSFFGDVCESKIFNVIGLATAIGENQSIYFYMKSIPDSAYIFYNEPPYINFGVRMYLDGDYLGQDNIFHIGEVPEFQLFEVPITITNADTMVIYIYGGSTQNLADGCKNHSYSWIDGLKIDDSSTTSNDDLMKSNINIFPNPSSGKLEIQGEWEKFQSFKVYDLLGRELEKGNLQSAELNLKSKGNLILILENSTKDKIVKKIFVN